MKLLTFLFLLICSISGFAKPIPISHVDKITPNKFTQELTVMMYIAGDNNLTNETYRNINQIREVGLHEGIGVTILRDGKSNNDDFVAKMTTDSFEKQPISEVNTGDPVTLYKFIKLSAKISPAKKYILIIWNHGNGWIQARPTVNSEKFGSKGVGVDDSSGNQLSIIQIRNVVALASQNGVKFETIGFDACLMANIEVAYELADYAKSLVFSEQTEAAFGWFYSAIFDKLDKNTANYIDFANFAVESYKLGFKMLKTDIEATMSAVDTAKLKKVVENDFYKFVLDLNKNIPLNDFMKIAKKTSVMECDKYYDLFDLLNNVNLSSANILQKNLSEAMLVVGNSGKGSKKRGGLTIYIPFMTDDFVKQEYFDFKFSKVSNWGKLMYAYLEGRVIIDRPER